MKQKRDDMAQSILNVLISKKISHNDIITGDESWSYKQTQILLPENSNYSLIPKPTNSMKKLIFLIYFSKRGIIQARNKL